MKVIVHYMRFHVPDSTSFDDLDEALGSAYWMVEDNTAWPSHITDEEGNVLLDHDALMDRLHAMDR